MQMGNETLRVHRELGKPLTKTNYTLIIKKQNNIDRQDAQDKVLYPVYPVCPCELNWHVPRPRLRHPPVNGCEKAR